METNTQERTARKERRRTVAHQTTFHDIPHPMQAWEIQFRDGDCVLRFPMLDTALFSSLIFFWGLIGFLAIRAAGGM